MKYGMKTSKPKSSGMSRSDMGQATQPYKVMPYKCRDMGREKPLPKDMKGYPEQAFGYMY